MCIFIEENPWAHSLLCAQCRGFMAPCQQNSLSVHEREIVIHAPIAPTRFALIREMTETLVDTVSCVRDHVFGVAAAPVNTAAVVGERTHDLNCTRTLNP